ncbi:MAG: GMC family oxidoreductase N-terminal domain-containing protein [Vicinamibacterales bacterium]
MPPRVSRRSLLAMAATAIAGRAVAAQLATPADADVVIVGGDPAALAAAYGLSRSAGVRVVFVDDRPGWLGPPPAAPSTVSELPAFARGHQRCFEGWADAGNDGWAYEDVVPSFRRLERYEAGESANRGGSGPIAVAHCWDPHALHRAFLRAAVSSGYQQDARHDFNQPRSQGVAGYYQTTHTDDGPQTFADALMRPAEAAGVVAVRGVVVTRLLVEDGRVRGVELLRAGRRELVRATRGVIVAASPVRAAQILQLSGIGPADVLRAAGVAVVADRAGVGRNLHAHLRIAVRWQAIDAALALPASTVTAGMFTVSLSASPPDLQIDLVDPRAAGGPWVGADVTLVRPFSRGGVRITTADPNAAPTIAPPRLARAADLTALVQGVRLARLLVDAAPLDDWRANERDESRGATSQAALESLVRTTARETGDAAGTCAMGPASDGAAVVDARLAVHGVTGLWVAGAAVMPWIVNAPPAAAALMTGDRAAEFLLNSRA